MTAPVSRGDDRSPVEEALDRLASLTRTGWDEEIAYHEALATVRNEIERLRYDAGVFKHGRDKALERAESAEAELRLAREGLRGLLDAAEIVVHEWEWPRTKDPYVDGRYKLREAVLRTRALAESPADAARVPAGECPNLYCEADGWVTCINGDGSKFRVPCRHPEHPRVGEPDGGGAK